MKNSDVTSIMSDVHYSVSRDAQNKFNVLPLALFGILFIFIPMIIENSRKLQDMAWEKPQRRTKPKH